MNELHTEHDQLNYNKNRINRIASIDFLRGVAIWIMVVLHVIMVTYNMDWLETNTSQASILLILLLVIASFFGAWCGFFLLLSSIGNMISMQKNLQRNQNIGKIMKKQIIGGFLLLLFAYFCEGVWGYQGYFARYLSEDIQPLNYMIDRAYTMETIHAVAWASIINGFVHGVLVKIFGTNQNSHLQIVYLLLAILWGQFVERKEEWIGGLLLDEGDSMDRALCGENSVATEITDITLEPNGDDSAFFSVEGKDYGCGFDVSVGGISGVQVKTGWLTLCGYGGHTWHIKKAEGV